MVNEQTICTIERGFRPCYSVKSLVKDWDPRPFRTIDSWYMESGFKELVKEKWLSYFVQGNEWHDEIQR